MTSRNFEVLRISGRTEDDRAVIAGWFPLVTSEGIPLELVVSQFEEHGLVPDWSDFIDAALLDGWNPRALRSKVEAAVGDVHGPKHREAVLERFELHVKNRATRELGVGE